MDLTFYAKKIIKNSIDLISREKKKPFRGSFLAHFVLNTQKQKLIKSEESKNQFLRKFLSQTATRKDGRMEGHTDGRA